MFRARPPLPGCSGYGCGRYANRGAAVCDNARLAVLPLVDSAIRDFLAKGVLRPAGLDRALDRAVALLTAAQDSKQRRTRQAELRKRLDGINCALTNLTDTAARGGAIPAILDALNRTKADALRSWRNSLIWKLHRPRCRCARASGNAAPLPG